MRDKIIGARFDGPFFWVMSCLTLAGLLLMFATIVWLFFYKKVRIMRIFDAKSFVGLLVVCSALTLSAQNANYVKEKVSGDFYFRLGPSGVPVYPRGAGRNEHWESGINLKLRFEKLEIQFSPSIAGAATFDNPDRFQFSAGASYKLARCFSAQAILTDAYSLNNIPPIDPVARRPTTGVNTLWVGGLCDLESAQKKVSIFARYGLRGNEPALFAHFTKPYARWHFGGDIRAKLNNKTALLFNPEIYTDEKFGVARATIGVGAERRLHERLFIGVRYSTYRNIGIPVGTTDHKGIKLRSSADKLFFSIRVPFGNDRW